TVPPQEAAPGPRMHDLARRLFPICRSITGAGVRETLGILRQYLPLEIHEVPSGTAAFGLGGPQEWSIREAFVEDESGRRVIDFRNHNLHVVGYASPVDRTVSLAELNQHLHSL